MKQRKHGMSCFLPRADCPSSEGQSSIVPNCSCLQSGERETRFRERGERKRLRWENIRANDKHYSTRTTIAGWPWHKALPYAKNEAVKSQKFKIHYRYSSPVAKTIDISQRRGVISAPLECQR